MRYLLTILSFFALQYTYAQSCNSGCDFHINNNNSAQNIDMNGGKTACVKGNVSISSMNFNGSNNTICIASGYTLTGSFSPGNVTINIYGTFNFSGNVNSNVIFNIYSGGKLTFSGTNLNAGTINNSGTLTFSNTGQISIQGVTITNNTGGSIIGTAPGKVQINQGSFTNNGTATFTNLENQEGNFVNNAGATLTFQQGTFQHGALHNYGAIVVNCSGGYSSDCSNACMKLGNKNAGQFTNDGNLTVHGSVCVGAGVIFHNNGTTTVDNNMNLENSNSQWVQGSGGSTNVGGTTTTNGGSFTGGNICSNATNGTVNSTVSCGGTPPVISDITATTCKNISVTIPIPAAAPSGATMSWSSLKLINGMDTVSAGNNNDTLITSNGTYIASYTTGSASVLFIPKSTYTGITSIKYRIGATSNNTTSYADPKNISVTVFTPPNKPQAIINNP